MKIIKGTISITAAMYNESNMLVLSCIVLYRRGECRNKSISNIKILNQVTVWPAHKSLNRHENDPINVLKKNSVNPEWTFPFFKCEDIV